MKATAVIAYSFLEFVGNFDDFHEQDVSSQIFTTFLNSFKCKALGDFLISFLEIVILKCCLGGVR